MGNYLNSWNQGPSQSQSQRKYYYTSLENINIDEQEESEDKFEDVPVPDLPTELWSGIIVQLSFSDKVGGEVRDFYKSVHIYRLISVL